tara:strand:- start:125 stop:718 length:594 start_codon:yes stop_codon:yes gene_type:complete
MDYFFSYLNYIHLISSEFFYLSLILFSIFLILYSIFSIPGLFIFIVLSGYLFGTYLGYLMSILSLTFGSFVFFICSKYIFSNFFSEYYKKYSSNIDKYIKNSNFEYLIILRLIPGPPLMLQNFLLSLLEVKYDRFLISTFLGFSPLVFTSTYIGNKLNDIQLIKDFTISNILSWDLLIFIFLIILLLFIRIKLKKPK